MSSPSLTFWGLCCETRGHLRWGLMTNGPVSLFEPRNFSGRGGPSRVHGAPSGGEVPVNDNPKRVTVLFTFAPIMHRKTRQNRECNSMYTFSRDAGFSTYRRPADFPIWNLRQTDR